MSYEIICGDCLDVMRGMDDNSVDAIVTDPPYGLKFMGRKWDYDVPTVEIWAECLRVLKPGGHLLAFAGTRTQHRMAVRIEDAGFEIRDMIAWVYGCGFPKSLNISKAIDKEAGAEPIKTGETKYAGFGRHGRSDFDVFMGNAGEQNKRVPVTAPATEAAQQWQGWGTALKPAFEPIILARKPITEKTIAANVLEWGTGGLNIDACRINADESYLTAGPTVRYGHSSGNRAHGDSRPWIADRIANGQPVKNSEPHLLGRWPANFVHDGSEEVMALFPTCKTGGPGITKANNNSPVYSGPASSADRTTIGYADAGSAARFFYTAKADKTDRNEGADNNHPTVKPVDLMVWLCKLVTPPGGTVLDPFMGSGSTGKAAIICDFNFVGIERDAEYVEIARARIEAKELPLMKEIRTAQVQPKQQPLFEATA